MSSAYSVYGFVIEADWDFQTELIDAPAEASIDLTWTVDRGASQLSAPAAHAAEIPYRTHAGPTSLLVFERDGAVILRFDRLGEFELGSREIRCTVDPAWRASGAENTDIEHTFLGPVLAVASSLRGRLALHASAVALPGTDRAIGFLASSRGGKTSLACELLRRGAELLTDDVLVIEPRSASAYAAWPQVKVWPDTAAHFGAVAADLERVSPSFEKVRLPIGTTRIGDGATADRAIGGFRNEPIALERLYLPRRGDIDPAHAPPFERLETLDAARQLIANSFAARTLNALGGAGGHLDDVLVLLESVSLHRFSYRDGFEHLTAAVDGILREARR